MFNSYTSEKFILHPNNKDLRKLEDKSAILLMHTNVDTLNNIDESLQWLSSVDFLQLTKLLQHLLFVRQWLLNSVILYNC